MERKELQILLKKYSAGTCTREEFDLLIDWYLKQDQQFSHELTPEIIEQDLQTIYYALPHHHKTIRLWPRVAAAVILLLIFGSLFFKFHKSTDKQLAGLPQQERFRNDVLPNRNSALLTLSQGQVVKLDSNRNGLIASDGNFRIDKESQASIIYRVFKTGNNSLQDGPDAFNKISIPQGGGKFKVTLSDGSVVWLNAASSITYPISFSGKERHVKLVGEAYFKIAHNSKAKFIVETPRGFIEDIGTEFNVMAYADEPAMRATLLKGAVKVITKQESKVLKPGQQVSVSAAAKNIRLDEHADTDAAIAWKNEEFQFNNDDLKSVLRQLQRWYNITIYPYEVPDTHFNGEISRGASLAQVLAMLEKTSNIRFAIEGKTLKVLKQ